MNLPTTKYTVQIGDTLYKIASDNNTNIPDLMEFNPNINPYTLFLGQIISIPNKAFRHYENAEYNIRLKYPFTWKRVEDTRYEGKSGFFNISAISSLGSVEDVCKSEACHRLLPYGSSPSIRRIRYMSQNACIIMPSDDQAPEMKNQAAFIVEYPFEITIQGTQYNYFLLWASKEHISEIFKTVKFKSLKD